MGILSSDSLWFTLIFLRKGKVTIVRKAGLNFQMKTKQDLGRKTFLSFVSFVFCISYLFFAFCFSSCYIFSLPVCHTDEKKIQNKQKDKEKEMGFIKSYTSVAWPPEFVSYDQNCALINSSSWRFLDAFAFLGSPDMTGSHGTWKKKTFNNK